MIYSQLETAEKYDEEEVARIFGLDKAGVTWAQESYDKPFPWSFKDLSLWATLCLAVRQQGHIVYDRQWAIEHHHLIWALEHYRMVWKSLAIDPTICDGAVHVAGTEIRADSLVHAIQQFAESLIQDRECNSNLTLEAITFPIGASAVASVFIDPIACYYNITPQAVKDCCEYAGVVLNKNDTLM